MPKARFYLRKLDDPKNETLILLYFSYNSKRAIISTELTIQPRYWNSKEQHARATRGQTDNADLINERLKEFKTAIENAYNFFKKQGVIPSVGELKQQYKIQLLPPEPAKKTPNFWEEFEKYLESSNGRVVADVIKDYRSLSKHLKGFEKNQRTRITFKSFKYSFYQQFMHYLTYDAVKPDGEKGLATNTVGKQIKNLKAFLNHCFRHEIAERFDLSDFKTMTEDTDAIYLTEDEINKIYSADLTSHPDLEEKRDLLVLGCQLGLRSNDLFRLKPEMVHDDMIRIKMHKSDKVVVIPLQPIAQEILKKYNGDIPNKSRRDVFNAEIKKIGRLAGIDSEIIITKRKGIEKVDNFYKKYELMSSHTCRRSFCTNQYLKGVPTVLLMKISGHSTEKAFMRYIKIDEEMAAQKMKEYW
ncbi:MAG: phage integrase SAM-like domain-containing protein [Bacteroidales bacterium]|jgi:integrase|nr:phage integrase SAM-like domain-containing protein [Bacteroidales bacterium]